MLVRKKDLVNIVNVSTGTIENWKKKGLPFVKNGGIVFYDVEAVKKWILAGNTN